MKRATGTRYDSDRARLLAAAKQYYEANREERRAYQREYQRQYRARNPGASAASIAWAKTNRLELNQRRQERLRVDAQFHGRMLARDAARRAAKLRATPKWADKAAILAIYIATPGGHQVDHIVPLTSPKVCGLHCEANLQYLTKKENASKYNRWWPDMPGEQRRAA